MKKYRSSPLNFNLIFLKER